MDYIHLQSDFYSRGQLIWEGLISSLFLLQSWTMAIISAQLFQLLADALFHQELWIFLHIILFSH